MNFIKGKRFSGALFFLSRHSFMFSKTPYKQFPLILTLIPGTWAALTIPTLLKIKYILKIKSLGFNSDKMQGQFHRVAMTIERDRS